MCVPPGRICHQSAEPLRPLVPSSDGQKGLELLVVSLQAGELGVAAWKIKKQKTIFFVENKGNCCAMFCEDILFSAESPLISGAAN